MARHCTKPLGYTNEQVNPASTLAKLPPRRTDRHWTNLRNFKVLQESESRPSTGPYPYSAPTEGHPREQASRGPKEEEYLTWRWGRHAERVLLSGALRTEVLARQRQDGIRAPYDSHSPHTQLEVLKSPF